MINFKLKDIDINKYIKIGFQKRYNSFTGELDRLEKGHIHIYLNQSDSSGRIFEDSRNIDIYDVQALYELIKNDLIDKPYMKY